MSGKPAAAGWAIALSDVPRRARLPVRAHDRRLKFGLERTRALLAALGDPHRASPHRCTSPAPTGREARVATRGGAAPRKRGFASARTRRRTWSTSASASSSTGARSTRSTSSTFVERWTPDVERLGATFFEATTAMAFDCISRARGVDVAVIETGLGGRLDSTNVVDPLAAGVTSIGFDHMEYLGPTLEAIAAREGGDLQAGRAGGDRRARRRRRASAAPAPRASEARAPSLVSRAMRASRDVRRRPRRARRSRSTALGERARSATPLARRATRRRTSRSPCCCSTPRDRPTRRTLADAAAPLPRCRAARPLSACRAAGSSTSRTTPMARAVLADDARRGRRRPAPVAVLLCVLADKDWRGDDRGAGAGGRRASS